MGLDMYLNKMPRYRNVTAKNVSAIESYFDWIKAKEEENEYANCTFERWCGYSFDDLRSIATVEFYRPFYKTHYSSWDTERKYGFTRIMEQVGYWRKANQIHNWFVEHVQDGVDDCCYHHEVTKEDLEELLDTCHEVLCNHDLAELRLPTQCGFFFGCTEYDEYYFDDLKNTIDIITKILETTDFDKEMIYYVSSW